MTILFCGGEPEDFVLSGTTSTNTTASNYRSTYARLAVGIATNLTFSANYAKASFTASSTFAVTARVNNDLVASGAWLLWLNSGANTRLRLKVTTGGALLVESWNGTTAVTLGSASVLTIAASSVYRLDVLVNYASSGGYVKVYVNGTLYVDTGLLDVTIGGSTTLDSVSLGAAYPSSGASSYWSEVIVSTQDSRTLSLKTMVPDAAGTTSAWTGAYTDIDEAIASDTDVISSVTAMQVTSVNCTGMPSGWSNLTVTAVKVMASAARGSTGPSKLALGVRTNSTDSFPTATTLDTGFSTPTTTYYELNPVTGIAWTTAEVDALQLAFRSET